MSHTPAQSLDLYPRAEFKIKHYRILVNLTTLCPDLIRASTSCKPRGRRPRNAWIAGSSPATATWRSIEFALCNRIYW